MDAVTRRSTSIDFVEEYAAGAERFALAVAHCDLRAPVSSCPPWSAYDLVVHLGNVHAWAATILETGQRAVEQNDEPRSTRPRIVSAWYAGKAEDLFAVLRAVAPDGPCWNFVTGAGVAAFWPRRQLHETTIHQVDLDLANDRTNDRTNSRANDRTGDQVTKIDAEVAADGVSEVLSVLMDRMHRRGHPARLDEPIALTATDTGDTWVVAPARPPRVPAQPVRPRIEFPPLTPTVEHRRVPTGSPAVLPTDLRDRVQAPADVLYRLLWHRPVEPGDVQVSGDESRVQAFLRSRLTP